VLKKKLEKEAEKKEKYKKKIKDLEKGKEEKKEKDSKVEKLKAALKEANKTQKKATKAAEKQADAAAAKADADLVKAEVEKAKAKQLKQAADKQKKMSVADQVAYLKKELGPEDPMSKLARSDFKHFSGNVDSIMDGRKDLGLTKKLIDEYNWGSGEASLAKAKMTPEEMKKVKLNKPKIVTKEELKADSQSEPSLLETQIPDSPRFIHTRTLILILFAGTVLALSPFVLAKRRRELQQQANEHLTSHLLVEDSGDEL